jgi:hypothetical protein
MSISWDRPVSFNRSSNLLIAAELASTFLFPHPLWECLPLITPVLKAENVIVTAIAQTTPNV